MRETNRRIAKESVPTGRRAGGVQKGAEECSKVAEECKNEAEGVAQRGRG
jgi:hypothetical protein